MPPATSRPPHSALRDLAILTISVAGFFVLAAHIELSEQVARWSSGYEHWQIDELPLTFLVLSLGLSWFSWRRWYELRGAMQARRRVEQENLSMLAQNRQLTQKLIQLQEQERAHIARELHDELGQCCVAIRVDAATISQNTQDVVPEAYESARAIIETADYLHDVVRGLLRRLRPTGLDELGLTLSLQLLIDRWAARCATPCAFSAEGALDSLDETTNIAIYRVVQESLTNIAQHANASRAAVSVAGPGVDPVRDDRQIVLTIEDDGTGLPLRSNTGGLGILGMQERIRTLGGKFSVESHPNGGTRVEALVPLQLAKATSP